MSLHQDIKTLDPQAQQAINTFIDLAIEKQKETFHSDLESFDSFANKLRTQLQEYFYKFHTQFYNGYEALIATLDKEPQEKNTASCHVTDEAWQRLQTPDVVFDAFQDGKTLQEVLGLSFEATRTLYEIACKLFEEKKLHEARNAFFFLTTISPQIPEFWLAKSCAHLELDEFEEAIAAAEEAQALAPEKTDALFSLIRAYIKMCDFDKALLVCDQGIDRAKECSDIALAQALEATMKEAKQYVEHEREVHYG